MKKLFNIVIVAMTALIVASCDYNEKNFPGYQDSVKPIDVQAIDYTMTDADYKTVATDRTNKALAESNGVARELKLVETQKAFNPQVTAQDYAPALLNYRFSTLDDKSAIRLTYNFVEDFAVSFPELNGLSITSLNARDYDTVYGAGNTKNWFETTAQISDNMGKILNGRVAGAENGTMVLVTYNMTDAKVLTSAIWKYNGTAWSEFKDNAVYLMQKEDYTAMGINYDNFSGSQADANLPTFLKQKFPYASADTKKTIVYKFYASGNTTVRADEYIYNGSEWQKNKGTKIVVKTDQFVKNNGVWVYNPSVTINLPAERNNPAIMAYYQAATDWVWENIDQPAGVTVKGNGYVTSYGNNDYYGGTSAYYNNVDHRPDKAREQVAKSNIEAIRTAYDNMTDEQLMNKLRENLVRSFGGMLEKMHPEAEPVEGIEVIYTINYVVYSPNAAGAFVNSNWTVAYKVTGKGKFEYIADSQKEIVQ